MKPAAVLKMEGFTDAIPEIHQDATKKRAQLLGQALTLKEVADPFVADEARDVLKELSDLSKDVEASRKALKAPVTALGKKIDAKAKEFCKKLLEEKTRIARLVGAFEAAERERQQKEEEKARREAQEAQWRAEAAIEAAKTPEEKAAAIETSEAVVEQTREKVATVAGSAEKRGRLITNIQFEVTDLKKLFSARPELCEIVPNNAAIREALKRGEALPGVTSEEVKTLSV